MVGTERRILIISEGRILPLEGGIGLGRQSSAKFLLYCLKCATRSFLTES